MRPALYAQLRAIARRACRDAGLVEDVVQDAMLAAVLAGRTDFGRPETARWLTGTVRNMARMAARGAARRQGRETRWQAQAASHSPVAETSEVSSLTIVTPVSEAPGGWSADFLDPDGFGLGLWQSGELPRSLK